LLVDSDYNPYTDSPIECKIMKVDFIVVVIIFNRSRSFKVVFHGGLVLLDTSFRPHTVYLHLLTLRYGHHYRFGGTFQAAT